MVQSIQENDINLLHARSSELCTDLLSVADKFFLHTTGRIFGLPIFGRQSSTIEASSFSGAYSSFHGLEVIDNSRTLRINSSIRRFQQQGYVTFPGALAPGTDKYLDSNLHYFSLARSNLLCAHRWRLLTLLEPVTEKHYKVSENQPNTAAFISY